MRTLFSAGWAGSVLALSCSLWAQQPVPNKPAEPKYTEIKYSADASSYRWEGDDRVLVLKGKVRFEQGDTILLADRVDYRESTRSATASGNLKVYDERNTITGDSCTIQFKEKKSTISGNVRMVVKPKPKSGVRDDKKLITEWKDEATINCDKVEYYYKDKRASIPSPVKITQRTRTVTADTATYSGSDETVLLSGNVKARDDKEKHSFAAPKVKMSLKEDDQWIEAEKATGSFYVKDEEDQDTH